MIIRNFITNLVLLVLLLSGFAFAGSSIPKYSVEPLPQYNSLFYNEKGWLGADGAYSLALSDNTTLWLYGDTFIGDIIKGKRKNTTIVNNSIAFQRGKDPSTVSVEFFWGTAKDGKPEAFFTPADGVGWLWPFGGILINDKLYFFLMQINKTEENDVFGFKIIGTWLAEVENPNDNPLKWKITQHKIPCCKFSPNSNLFFGSALMKDKDFVYIYGCIEERGQGKEERSMIVARVPPDFHCPRWDHGAVP